MDSTTLMMENKPEEEKTVCALCLKEESRYTCPRCNIRYCSVACYKSEKHLECSERFYKDCFMEGLKQRDVSNEERMKMMDMLARVEEDTDINQESDDELDLAERIDGLDLDNDAEHVWSRLTEKEKKEFEKMASDGRLGNLIEIWTPWWNLKDDKIQELDKVHLPDRPNSMKNIPDVSKLLTKSKPSSDIKHNIVNILYSYAYVCRLHNGDHMDCPSESAQELLGVSDVMDKDMSCASSEEAVSLCLQSLQKNSGKRTTRAFEVSIIQDVVSILSGPSEHKPLVYVESALSESYRMLKRAHKELRKELKSISINALNQQQNEQLKQKLYRTMKKLEFLLGWTQRFGMVLSTLIPELQLQYCALSSELATVEQTREKFEESWGGKIKPVKSKLVEELT